MFATFQACRRLFVFLQKTTCRFFEKGVLGKTANILFGKCLSIFVKCVSIFVNVPTYKNGGGGTTVEKVLGACFGVFQPLVSDSRLKGGKRETKARVVWHPPGKRAWERQQKH